MPHNAEIFTTCIDKYKYNNDALNHKVHQQSLTLKAICDELDICYCVVEFDSEDILKAIRALKDNQKR